jgi:para-nitrobenzyl esterase
MGKNGGMVQRRLSKLLLGFAVAAVAAVTAVPVFGEAAGSGRHGDAVVATDSGPVRGVVAAGYRVFRGIPYARPPVGELRWRAPRLVRPWSKPRDATQSGNACAQEGLELGEPSTSEDCLYLEVTTPGTPGGRTKPVMVYLHGGSFQDGAGSIYGAQNLAVQGDVVVVTVNYRLGVFGFLSHPALTAAEADGGSGAFGLLDQQAALRWVQRNIRAFGGDPNNVTLVGESAGAIAVCAHLTTPGSAGMFNRAIIQSAPCTWRYSPTAPNLPRDRATADAQGVDLVRRIDGLGTSPTAADLRSIGVEQLLTSAASHPGFGPVFGGPVLPVEPAVAIASGQFHRVPVLQGTTHDEARLHLWGMEIGLYGGQPMPDEAYDQMVRGMFGEHGDAILARYPREAYASASEAFATVWTDGLFARPALDSHATLAKYVPTYAYEFAEAGGPWFRQGPPVHYPMGAYHTGDLPYLFAIDHFADLPDGQQQLSDAMIGYWTRFARTADPNGAHTPRWRPFTADRQVVQSLSAARIGPADFADDHQYGFWTSLDS